MNTNTLNRKQNETHKHDRASALVKRDPNKAIQQMMDTIDALRHVYDQETEALQRTDIKGFLDVQDKKLDVTARYHREAITLLNNKDEIKDRVDPALRQKLLSMEEKFTASTRDNLDAIEKASRIMKRLHDRIMSAARRTAINESVQYGSSGELNGEKRKVVTTGINETA